MRVGVIGLGYVGLPLAVAFAQQNADVIAVDLDARKLSAIAAGESYIEDLTDAALQAVGDRLEPTADYARLADADAVLICAPTPLSPNREPDLEPLLGVVRELSRVLRVGQLVVLESTTYPG